MRTKKEQARRQPRSRNARKPVAPLQVPPDRPGFDETAAEMTRFPEEEIGRQDEPLLYDLDRSVR
jgi:hypothetical protein